MGRAARESVPTSGVPGEYDHTLYSYEASPRGVLSSTTRPGEAWHKGNKAATTRTYANKTNSGELQVLIYTISSGGTLAQTGRYKSNTLLIEESTDEDGHIARKFTDRRGLTVATSEGRSGDMLTTTYVYDDYGRLRYILPPDMPSGNLDAETLADKAYSYGYDACGRLVESRVPGCAPSRTRYSRAGRVVAEHPSAMAPGLWLLRFYDSRGREVLTSLASPTEAQLTSLCDTLRVASYFGYNLHGGYKFDRALPCDFGKILTATYYDDYSFASRTDADFGFDRPQVPQVNAAAARGQLTGSCDYSADPAAGLGTLYAYNAEGLVAETYAMTPAGRRHLSYTYDLAGNILTETESLDASPHSISRSTVNTYDAAGRIARREITENGVEASVEYAYDSHGRLRKEAFGNEVERLYKYETCGLPALSTIRINDYDYPVVPGGTLPTAYYSTLDPGLTRDGLLIDHRVSFTDRLLYTDGAAPRYSGCPSARITSRGGRYDYHFDDHDRLVRADYTPGPGAPEGEDYSTEYAYDCLYRPLRMKRYGLINAGLFNETEFGLLDNLSYSYDGPRLARVSQNMEGSEFYGRTGMAAKGSSYGWNDAGLMTADLGAGITDIRYSHLGQPVTVVFGSGEETLDMTYTAAGEPVSRRYTISGRRGSVWTTVYTAGREFYSTEGALQSLNPYISYFPGGFFDGNGGVHYLHADYQGSVMMQTGADGLVEEHTAYYPYGEMWNLPTMRGIDNAPHVTQTRHYQGKERIAATGDTDFGPRWHNTAAAIWRAPDLKAADYPNISPYTFCAANPIKYADPTGMEFTTSAREAACAIIGVLWADVVKDIANNNLNSSSFSNFSEVKNELDEMEKSDLLFDVEYDKNEAKYGKTVLKAKRSDGREAVTFTLPAGAELDLVAHEFKHGYQFMTGRTSLAVDIWRYMGRSVLHDIHDEKEAYDRAMLFGGAITTLDEIKSDPNYQNIHRGDTEMSLETFKNKPMMLQRIRSNHFQQAIYMDGKIYYKKP